MTAPNSNYTDLITTTLEYMGPEIVDAVTTNNAVLAWLKQSGTFKVIPGGRKIVLPHAWNENPNTAWYSGADALAVGLHEDFTASEFDWKQISSQVVSTGLEIDVQNVGKAAQFDLVEERIKNAKRAIANTVSEGIFSDGTGSGGKQLVGLLALCDSTPTTGTYGGIDRSVAANAYWRNKFTDTGADPSHSTIQGYMNAMWYSLIRGSDKPNLIVEDANVHAEYEESLQLLQRFTDPNKAQLGFNVLKYKSADVVLDGNCTTKQQFYLNTEFVKFYVAANRNFKPLKARVAYNQDVECVVIAAACAMGSNHAGLQGRIEYAA